MTKRPSINTGLRLPPFTKKALRSLLTTVSSTQGHRVKQDDLVAVLIARASAASSKKDLDALGQEVRDHRIKAEKIGY